MQKVRGPKIFSKFLVGMGQRFFFLAEKVANKLIHSLNKIEREKKKKRPFFTGGKGFAIGSQKTYFWVFLFAFLQLPQVWPWDGFQTPVF